METRQREDGQWIDNCLGCDHCCELGKNAFECNHLKTGHHRYDELHDLLRQGNLHPYGGGGIAYSPF